MTFSTTALVIGLVASVLLLDALCWRGVRHLTLKASGWAPRIRTSRAWARVRPVRAWLKLRHPRFYAVLAVRLDPHLFTGLPLTLLVVGAIYIAALLGGLIEEVLEAGGVLRFDQAINAFFTSWRTEPLLVKGFLWITALGAGPTLTAVAVTATAFLWAGGRRGATLPLWVVFLGAEATTWAGKYAIDRHRPMFIDAVSAASPSFPSGHATGAMAVFGFLAYALARALPEPRGRFEVVYWTSVLILLIGFSRIFLSVHYTTDVLSGFMVGGFWLLVGFGLAEWVRLHASRGTP
ncbi:phosphoesterase PA-phosphatase-like protein [Hyphomicrobium denitrificans 1NES1]|uniref:Phosphoesterase PA-phosphatase-like protein n=1 Tax=Hyphomicrobium denitrificans 1NES1 TaxID=670307 RepID=N0BH21_9HYPH|nr:phosphatase PAP2 family protein [Hyphomicrobium denitrificans]AGK59741.1 phosphoesterase PA-phosphatase-like protein [Hyphomicrobium denitrificans 1NES1]